MAQSYQCISCIHFNIGWSCKAFPEGIPEEIYSGQFDHSKPYKKDGQDDNGVRYTPDPDAPDFITEKVK